MQSLLAVKHEKNILSYSPSHELAGCGGRVFSRLAHVAGR
jgi:hypothetical protein